MDGSRISVALCTYNGARYLREQLASIAAQTLAPAELVVSDDASTDATLDIVADFAARAPFPVRTIRNTERVGAPANFGIAIAACEGDRDRGLIALADQDDVWRPNKIAMLADALRSDPERAYAFCDALVVDAGLRSIGDRTLLARRFPLRQIEHAFREGAELRLMLKRDFIYGTTLMFRASVRDLVLPIEPGWSHDTWICNVLTFLGYRGVPVLEPLVLYRQHGVQHSGGIGAPRSVPYDEQVMAYEALRSRLADMSARAGRPLSERDMTLLDGKIHYLRALSAMQRSAQPGRSLTAAREVVSGRWRRYSPRIFWMNTRVLNALERRR